MAAPELSVMPKALGVSKVSVKMEGAGGGEGENLPSVNGRIRFASVSSALRFSDTTCWCSEAYWAAPELTLKAATRGNKRWQQSEATCERTFQRAILKVLPVAARVRERRLDLSRLPVLALGAGVEPGRIVLGRRSRAATGSTSSSVALGSFS